MKKTLKETFTIWLVDKLPDIVSYFVIIKVLAIATTGENSSKNPSEVTAFDLLDITIYK